MHHPFHIHNIIHHNISLPLSKVVLINIVVVVITFYLIDAIGPFNNTNNPNNDHTVDCINAQWFISQHKDVYNRELAANHIAHQYASVLHSLPTYKSTHHYSNKIFWCWLDGEDNAPPLYQACLNALRKQCNSDKAIIVISLNNLDQYVKLPDSIIQKYMEKKICPAHFADIIRVELLSIYGGTWIDASVLMTDYNPDFFNRDLFFFQSYKRNDLSNVGSNWFITAEQGSPVLQTTRDLLYEYWKRNDKAHNYYIFHFFFRMAYLKYKNHLTTMPKYSNLPPHDLREQLGRPFSTERYTRILRTSSIHKLTVKTMKTFPAGVNNLTYHHILREFGKGDA